MAWGLYFVSEPSYKYTSWSETTQISLLGAHMLVAPHIWCRPNLPELLRLAVPWPCHDIYQNGYLLESSQLWQCRAHIECPCRESAAANLLPHVLHLQCSLYLHAGGAGMGPDGMAEEEHKGFAKSPGRAVKRLFFASAVPLCDPAPGILSGYALACLPEHIPNRCRAI